MLLSILETAFILSAAAVFYVYLGFPALLLLLTRGRTRRAPAMPPDAQLPSVSFVVAAYNEELVIEQKLKNCLAIDYPPDKLTFVFVSDSTDGTNGILRRYLSERVQAALLPERRGKVHALHTAFAMCTGEILVLSDANTYYRPDALRKLVRHFADPHVGLVTGDVRILPTSSTFGEGEGLYYRYERRLQMLETAFGSTVAIDGAMYALRRSLLMPASNGLVADDLVTAMNVGLQNFRMIYDPEAIAEENPTPGNAQEFNRKVRVVAYAMQSFLEGEGVPRITQTRLWWTYVSHKLLRWFVPFFLIAAFLSAMGAAIISPAWAWVLAVHIAFYLLALVAWRVPTLKSRLFRVPYYFSMVNLAALLGVIRGMRRGQKPVWMRTERLQRGA